MTEPLGTFDEKYDALRVLSILSRRRLPGNVPVNANIGHKVLHYDAASNVIASFDPTQAGLIAALATADAGDTVWLPSKIITLTASISVPQQVAMVGVSLIDSVLQFSGFSGTAITLALSAYASEFSFIFQATGTTAIGIDARAAGVKVVHVLGVAFGGSTKNRSVLIGQP